MVAPTHRSREGSVASSGNVEALAFFSIDVPDAGHA
jgi:hypothetical protein